jgi:ectoine hydroxylase-related dioxygenase (phytanoyl-CoA dioxygenase family)
MSAATTTTLGHPSVVLHQDVSDAFVEQFRRDGFAVLEGALTPDELAEVHAEMVRLCRGDLGTVGGEFQADQASTDEDVLRRYLCIHQPHKVSDVYLRALSQPRIVEALTNVIGPDVKAMQSMVFMKSEGKPGQAWHQDEFFIPTRDRSLTAAWIALDDATIENGCLWVLPGSHQPGIIYPDRDQDDERFDCSIEAFDFPYTDDDAVPVEMPAGAAVIFNGYLLHRSLPNTGKHGFRRALANHYMSAQSLLPWFSPKDGTPIGQLDYRDIVLVAGRDPYAYKGFTDVARPHVRPDGEGGCGR